MKYSEACLLAGAWMVVSGLPYGWVLVGLSGFFAFARFSIDANEKKQKKEDTIAGINSVAELLTSGLAGLSNGKDRTIH